MKKFVCLSVLFMLMMATATCISASAAEGRQNGATGGKTLFVSGYQKIMPDMTGTRIKTTKADNGIRPPYHKTVAITYQYVFTGDYGGHYLGTTENRINDSRVVYGKDSRSGEISFELPEIITGDIDLYWVEGYRIIIDKEKNIVITLAETAAGGELAVTAYEVSGFALRDMTYLGAYRDNWQTKLIVSDGLKVYIVNLETMRNEQEYELHGYRPIGANLGLPLDKRGSRLGVWLTSQDNKTLNYMDLPSGEISEEADMTQFNVNGEFVKLVSGWSGYITGGYGGVFLVKDNQHYSLYDSKFKRLVDQYPYEGKQLGDVKDIFWAIRHGIRTRAVVIVTERAGEYLTSNSIEASEFFEKPANQTVQ